MSLPLEEKRGQSTVIRQERKGRLESASEEEIGIPMRLSQKEKKKKDTGCTLNIRGTGKEKKGKEGGSS